MIDFGPIIIEDGLIQSEVWRKRQTVRAVIQNESGALLMVYSKMFDDYTFPGGGIQQHEDITEALKRELHEELGALSVLIKEHIGQTQELRYGVKGTDHVYLQTSDYYLCEIPYFGEQHLMEREMLHGLEPRWINIEDALMHNLKVMNNDRHQVKGLKTVLIRENKVLKALKENNHETI